MLIKPILMSILMLTNTPLIYQLKPVIIPQKQQKKNEEDETDKLVKMVLPAFKQLKTTIETAIQEAKKQHKTVLVASLQDAAYDSALEDGFSLPFKVLVSALSTYFRKLGYHVSAAITGRGTVSITIDWKRAGVGQI